MSAEAVSDNLLRSTDSIQFRSTQQASVSDSRAGSVDFTSALLRGAADNGGLYIPEYIPRFDFVAVASSGLPDLAAEMLAPFAANTDLESLLPAICKSSMDFPVPLVQPDAHHHPGLHVLELFHGPTGAFKDIGARFLLQAMSYLSNSDGQRTILAATSGDTGGAVGAAVASAVASGSKLRAIILFPKDRVSAFQKHQLCCWGNAVTALEVDGDFDMCQRLVKSAFANTSLREAHQLTSANSINIGRLLPQATYLAHAALTVQRESGKDCGLIIPTGNLGHAVAGLYARAMGAPVGPVVLATNANSTLQEWHESGRYQPRASVATIANAMDVGAPSNFARLQALSEPNRAVTVVSVNDQQIKQRIRDEYQQNGYVWCPHSAVAAEAYARLDRAEQQKRNWVLAGTAHPYKFADIVEPLIGRAVTPSRALHAVLERPVKCRSIAADLRSLSSILEAH